MAEKNLSQNILETIARFDLFDYPLTDFEIWQFLSIKALYSDIKNNLPLTKLNHNNGFWFLPQRQEIINIRQNRYRLATDKIKLIKQRLKLITWLPAVKLITLANIIGPNNIKSETDIDLFIVTEKNRVWLVKFLATIILKILNLRPTDKNFKNKLCLSFLVDETALDLSACRLNNNDWYFTYWLAGLMPMWGNLETYNKLLANNNWLNQVLPNWQTDQTLILKHFQAKNNSPKQTGFGNYLEKLSKKLHQKFMSQTLKQAALNNTSVIITDHILKLHTLDRRLDFFALAEKKFNNLAN